MPITALVLLRGQLHVLVPVLAVDADSPDVADLLTRVRDTCEQGRALMAEAVPSALAALDAAFRCADRGDHHQARTEFLAAHRRLSTVTGADLHRARAARPALGHDSC